MNTDNFTNQLEDWWNGAEEGVIEIGDRLIYRDEDNYDFRTATAEDAGTGAEKEHEHGWGILHRAPAPKPAWHNAVAVIASGGPIPEERRVMVKCGETVIGLGPKIEYWEDSASGVEWRSDDLRDVTPLIEAKVTDEMVLRALNAEYEHEKPLEWYARGSILGMRAALHAALTLDPA